MRRGGFSRRPLVIADYNLAVIKNRPALPSGRSRGVTASDLGVSLPMVQRAMEFRVAMEQINRISPQAYDRILAGYLAYAPSRLAKTISTSTEADALVLVTRIACGAITVLPAPSNP